MTSYSPGIESIVLHQASDFCELTILINIEAEYEFLLRFPFIRLWIFAATL